jgi:hypothetical protein
MWTSRVVWLRSHYLHRREQATWQVFGNDVDGSDALNLKDLVTKETSSTLEAYERRVDLPRDDKKWQEV